MLLWILSASPIFTPKRYNLTVNDEENSPGCHGRVGDSHCINTPGCQTVKFLWAVHAKCQWKAKKGGAFTIICQLGKIVIINTENTKVVENTDKWWHLRGGLDITDYSRGLKHKRRRATEAIAPASYIGKSLKCLHEMRIVKFVADGRKKNKRSPLVGVFVDSSVLVVFCRLSFQERRLSVRMRWP